MPTGAASFFGTFAVDWEPTTWGTETIVDGVDQSRGFVNSQGLLETTDPRLTGSVVRASNSGCPLGGGSLGRGLQWDWDGQPYRVTVLMLTGEGDYEATSAHLTVDWSTLSEDFSEVEVRGAVFAGEPPPFPELPAGCPAGVSSSRAT